MAPVSFYLGNLNEITFDLIDIAFPVFVLFIGISLFLFFLLYRMRSKDTLFPILSSLIIGSAIAIWIQSQLFVWDFGPFNGQDIRWLNWKKHMLLEAITWVSVISLAIVLLRKRSYKVNAQVLTGVYLAGFLSLGSAFFLKADVVKNNLEVVDTQGLYTFHPKKNVLIILLDTYQSDYFEYILKNYPEDVAAIDGFTFYRNTISKFPTTKASLPSIVTGEIYLNDRSFRNYVEESYDKFNIADAYKELKYQSIMVGFKGLVPDVLSMKDVVQTSGESQVSPFTEYLDYAIFRAFPTCVKPYIYRGGLWFFSALFGGNHAPGGHGIDISFVDMLVRNADVTSSTAFAGTFKLLHFTSPHPPWLIDENLQFDPGLHLNHQGYLKQARGAIKMACKILVKLKKLNIYDQTEIVIISDHGTTNAPYLRKDAQDFRNILNPVLPFIRSSSMALLLHKPAGSRGKIKPENMPMEMTDLACLLGIRDSSHCINYKLAQSGIAYSRTFYYYQWDDSWPSDHMPAMREYAITGHVYDAESYHEGNKLHTSKGIVTVPAKIYYPLGSPVLFAADGNSSDYIRGGWSYQEATLRWTDGSFAGISFNLDKTPTKDLRLKLWGGGFSKPGSSEHQQTTVFANGQAIASWEMNEAESYEAVIPLNIIEDDKVDIVFELSNPGGTAEDPREHGMAVYKIVVDD